MTQIHYPAFVFSTLVVLGAQISQAQVPAPPVTLQQAPTASDDVLQDRIQYRLETSATLRTYDVKAAVDKGVATVSGTVASAAQKEEAGRVANLDGITRVENTVAIDPGVDKSVGERLKGGLAKTGERINDGWITTKISWFFVGEELLKGSDINVDTKDNRVTLKGTVGSPAARTRAMELARDTQGVKAVVDQLTIHTTVPQP